MAVQSGTSAAIYTGNNSVVTPYPVPFPYLLASDVYLAVRDADDQDTVLQQGVDYTLTSIEDTHGNITGGSVVTAIEYDNTWTVTIFRQVSLTQLTELPEAGPISSRVLEKAYDKAAMALQQIHRRVLALEGADDGGSVIVIPEGSTGDVLQDVQTFADTAARGNAIPRRVGQLGVQIDNGTLWRSNGAGAGGWTRAITLTQVQASADARLFGRKTSGSGNGEELTLSEVLDFIGSAAQGDLLYRGAAAWARLAAGTAGQVLRTGGSGANPAWGHAKVVNVWRASTTSGFTTTSQIPFDNTIPQNTEGVEVLSITLTPSSSSNKLLFWFGGYCVFSNVSTPMIGLFRDSGASALYARAQGTVAGVTYQSSLDFHCTLDVPSTASQTWKVRTGPAGGVTMYINQISTGAALGSVNQLTLTVMEVQP